MHRERPQREPGGSPPRGELAGPSRAGEPPAPTDTGPVADPAAAMLLRLRAGGNRAAVRRVGALRRATLQRQPGHGGNAGTFDDDPLSAGGFSDADTTIRVRPGPVRTTTITPSASGPTVPGRSRVVEAPPPVPGIVVPHSDDDGVHPAVDLAADAHTVTVTFLLRNFNLPASGDATRVDFLHEPGVSIQVTPGDAPKPVIQAAIAAMNAHLRRHGRDLVELSLSPQASVDSGGHPAAGVQAQAEIHVTASFSFTASSSLSVAPHSDDTDPGSVRLTGRDSRVDVTWSPVSIGVLWHLDAQERHDSGPPLDYAAVEREGRYINWVVDQLDPADFTPAGPRQDPLERYEFVRPLLYAMRAASGDEAQWTLHLGAMRPGEIPPGLTHGLTRAAQIIASSGSEFSGLRRVRVSMLNLGPSGDGPEQLIRWTLLPLDRDAVAPPASAGGAP